MPTPYFELKDPKEIRYAIELVQQLPAGPVGMTVTTIATNSSVRRSDVRCQVDIDSKRT